MKKNHRHILNEEPNFFRSLDKDQQQEHIDWLYIKSPVAKKLRKTGKYKDLYKDASVKPSRHVVP